VFEEIRAMATDERTSPEGASHFLHEIIERDLAANRHGGRVVTRFPPEPNGFLHIGHAKSICLNFGLAQRYGGVCHLRLDDTNPTTEDIAYVEAIQRDVKWLGFDWADKLFFASDYYEKLYAFAEQLIRAGKAYVCSLSEEEFRVVRGTVNEPGRESPYRSRSVEENLDLFARMRAGEFPDGAHVVRAKIDMASPNMKMRDWPLLRIRHEHHYRRGDSFCVYPLYDFAHCLSDYLENITHSVCTLEFESNRELYDWILEAVGADPLSRPRQYEFARLSLTTTMMSKRKLLELVERKLVSGWDDPRMPTLSGLRRRGVTPEALRDFCERIGIAKTNSVVEIALFDHVLREDLDPRSPRVMGVLRPLEVVLTDLPEGETVELDAPYWPAELGRPESRKVPLSRRIFIEQDDFMEEPPKDFHRLAPGREVRLRHAAVIRCDEVVKDPATGAIVELRCSRVPAADGKRVKGTIHWVSKAHAVDAEVRLYDRLFVTEMPGQSDDVASELNPRSLEVLRGKLEPSLASAKGGDRFQLERLGFFVVDDADSRPGAPVLARTVMLKDTWAKISARSDDKAPKAEPRAKPAEAPKGPTKAAPATSAAASALAASHGLADAEARLLEDEPLLRALLEGAIAAGAPAKIAAKWLAHDVRALARGAATLPFDGAAIAELVSLVEAGTITNAVAKELVATLVREGGSPRALVARGGLAQLTDGGAIEAAVDAVLAESAALVARFRAGNANVLGALVGQVMRKTGGKASPQLVDGLLRKKLGAAAS
jgi:glutaminyl-tRNA synthetase